MQQLTTDDIQQAREALERILAGIASGELAAAPLLAHGIQGAVATLGVLQEESSPPPSRRPPTAPRCIQLRLWRMLPTRPTKRKAPL